MENQKISHWVVISVLSMLFCLLMYTLTGEPTPKTSAFVHYVLTWRPPVTPTRFFSRCVRLPDVWTRRRLRHLDVISRKWCGHDHFQATFWNLNYHGLSDHSPSGEVSLTRVGLFCTVWLWVCSRPHCASLCGTDQSSWTWCYEFADMIRELWLARLRVAAGLFSLWSGSPSHFSLPCLYPTWVMSSVSSEESAPSSSSSFPVGTGFTSMCVYICNKMIT